LAASFRNEESASSHSESEKGRILVRNERFQREKVDHEREMERLRSSFKEQLRLEEEKMREETQMEIERLRNAMEMDLQEEREKLMERFETGLEETRADLRRKREEEVIKELVMRVIN